MRFIAFGLKLLRLRFFAGMEVMSVVDDMASCVFHHNPVLIRVSAGRPSARALREERRLNATRGGWTRTPCDNGSRLFFLNIRSE